MQINGVEIVDTFAEAFTMYGTRIRVTAASDKWAYTAAREASGFATSIIECGIEGGIEKQVKAEETLDHRPGYDLIFLTMDKDSLQEELVKRVGQTIMTSATSACYNSLFTEDSIEVGGNLRYFGDGYQISKLYGNRRFWRIPIMEGEFLIEESFGITKGVGGGNFLILGENRQQTLAAAERAVKAIKEVDDVILPFPGGIVSSGSKTKSKYNFLSASTNTKFCPVVREQVDSKLTKDENSVLEIVIDGLNQEAISRAIKAGIEKACGPGISRITAGNYNGELGAHKFELHRIMRGELS